MGLPSNRTEMIAELRRRIIAKYERAWRDGIIDADRISFGSPQRNNPQSFDRDQFSNKWLDLTRPVQKIDTPENRKQKPRHNDTHKNNL